MAEPAFTIGPGFSLLRRTRSTNSGVSGGSGLRRQRCAKRICMQLPPPGSHWEPPLTAEQRGPENYKWDPNFPGTLKPGTCEDNWPLADVLASGVYERMVYQEFDTDECKPVIAEPDEDLLEWLAREGRLIPRDVSEDEFDVEPDRHTVGITEEDLEYGDDDGKMLAYYSRQGEGSAAGSSTDFGGFSESFTDADAGFGL